MDFLLGSISLYKAKIDTSVSSLPPDLIICFSTFNNRYVSFGYYKTPSNILI